MGCPIDTERLLATGGDMTHREYPSFDVLLNRLLDGGDAGAVDPELRETVRNLRLADEKPGPDLLNTVADALSLHRPDVFLIAGVAVPDEALPQDDQAGGELPRLVRSALQLPASGTKQLCDYARALPQEPRTQPHRVPHLYQQYPPGFGGLLVRLLALRNLNWIKSAQVLSLMSGVHLSASTIGAVGRGKKDLDSDLLAALAVVLGVPAPVLSSLTNLPVKESSPQPSAQTAEVAELLWLVRRLTADQVRQLREMAEGMRRGATGETGA
ncbi:hypothetical protein ACW4TU_18820 [Streptomyces sp. QTS52]